MEPPPHLPPLATSSTLLAIHSTATWERRMTDRVIKVDALTRVEGEGGLYVRLKGDKVEDVRLEIYEPPRLFESLLRGRALEETPDITARICGICPVAYQMSSVHALESALGIEVNPEIRRLRRLLYCGEWIESHSLHMCLLHAPDFLGFDSGLEMAEKFPTEAQHGLRMKQHGNELLAALGGRAIHPVNVGVAGFYRSPKKSVMQALIPHFQWCLDTAIAMTKWAATFPFPDFECDYQFVCLSHPDEYPMNAGSLATSDGESIPAEQFNDEFEEQQKPHSTALHCVRRKTGAPYHVGPLARMSLCFDRLSPTAQQVSNDLGLKWPCYNPFKSILARSLELIHAFEEALEILRDYEPPAVARESYSPRAGVGHAITEAPRGILYHRYEVNAQGKIAHAQIVPPTSQNQARIERDLKAWTPHALTNDPETTGRLFENLVRCYDPCISCSTHFLKVIIDRQPVR